MLEPNNRWKYINSIYELYIEKYTKIFIFVLMAGRDICEFTRAVRNLSNTLLLFRENRSELWISNWAAWNKVISAILKKVKKKIDYKYNPKYK